MRTLLMADIHGNFAALRAILSTPEAQSCGRVISLGDQVNFGPESRKVVETLRSLGATMLMGNHEERLLHPDDFAGYNWAMLRVTARQLSGISLADLPVDVRIGSALLTHGTRRPVPFGLSAGFAGDAEGAAGRRVAADFGA